MNKDSREEGVTSKALKVVGGATAIGGVGYGVHKGMNSKMATDFISKDFGEKGPGLRAKTISKYRDKVNPFVDTTKGAIKDMFSKKPTETTATNPNDIVLKNKEVIKNPEKRHSSKTEPIKKPLSGEAGNIVINTAGDTAGGGNINTPMDTDIAINPKGDTPVSQKFERKENLAKSKEIVTDSVGNTKGGKNINAPEVKPDILNSNGTPINGGGSKTANILGADGNPLKGGSKASKIITGQADDAAKIILNGADDAAAGAAKIITKLL